MSTIHNLDSIGYIAGMNLYVYVGNIPLRWVDPLGMEKEDNNNLGSEPSLQDEIEEWKENAKLALEMDDRNVGELYEGCKGGNISNCLNLFKQNAEDVVTAKEYLKLTYPDEFKSIDDYTIIIDYLEEKTAQKRDGQDGNMGSANWLFEEIHIHPAYESFSNVLDTLAHESLHLSDSFWDTLLIDWQDNDENNQSGEIHDEIWDRSTRIKQEYLDLILNEEKRNEIRRRKKDENQ